MTATDSAEATADSPAEGESADDAVEPDALAALTAEQPIAEWADERQIATALTWVDPASVAAGTTVGSFDEATEFTSGAALLKGARLRPLISRPGLLVPLGMLVGLAGAYAGTTILWPLHEVMPTAEVVEFATTPAAAAEIAWPVQGSAAVGAAGLGTAASSVDPAAIASITKVVSSLMVLDRMPLAVGEEGPSFSFTRSDNLKYWDYRRSDQSALDVPVGGSLTQLQLLQGTLLGSANNYIDRLAAEIWGSDRAFAEAAATWLRERGLDGITVVNPSGFSADNTATPEALLKLAERAMQNPVFASIVSTPAVELPGAGYVANTNGMLVDAGVVGVKTGTLGESWNLLTAKDFTVDDTVVRLYASVLGQSSDEQRLAETRALFAQIEAALQAQEPAVPAGTVVGTVQTQWGEEVDIVTDADADVVLWNGTLSQAVTEFDLGDRREDGDEVGTLTTSGPLNTVTTPLALAEDVEDPSIWWRLTHPLELFGLTEAQR